MKNLNLNLNLNIETERLLIRPIRIADSVNILAYRSDPLVNKHQGFVPKAIIDVVEFIKSTSPVFDTPYTWFQYAIVLVEKNKLIGDIGLHFLDGENKQVEIGFTLNKMYQKKGYATEALKRMITYLFNDLHKHRIIASVDPENSDLFSFLEKLGFRKEAYLKESLQINGEWVDEVIYALLEKEWPKGI